MFGKRKFDLASIFSKEIKISFVKLNPDAIEPKKGYDGDAAFDLFAFKKIKIPPHSMQLVEVGIAVNCPPFVCWTLRARGSQHLGGVWVYPGMGDPGYKGDIGTNIWNTTNHPLLYQRGERVGSIQFMIRLNVVLQETFSIESSPRGPRGFGSTGR